MDTQQITDDMIEPIYQEFIQEAISNYASLPSTNGIDLVKLAYFAGYRKAIAMTVSRQTPDQSFGSIG